jgi:ferric-dicitrate binding protein FerR (iron transport regulator)
MTILRAITTQKLGFYRQIKNRCFVNEQDVTPMKEQLQQIIRKYSEGKLSLSEQIDLAEQLADEQNQDAQELLHKDWINQLNSASVFSENLNPILDKVHHKIHIIETCNSNKKIWLKNFQRIAAILVFPLFVSLLVCLYFQNKTSPTAVAYTEIECPMGARIKFQLPDGSTGNLNSGSRLKYRLPFVKDRKVELVGEAYFDVVHNAQIPFLVSTQNLRIKVLGTSFDVIAFEDEATEEIILSSGKVDVSSRFGNHLAVLKPNEKLALNIDGNTFTTKEVEASQYTSWTQGKLVFRNENMKQVANRLSRWYNVDVKIEGHELDDYTFHATFVDEPLDEVLKLLAITTPISYKEEVRKPGIDDVYQKRKINLKINSSKIKHFK